MLVIPEGADIVFLWVRQRKGGEIRGGGRISNYFAPFQHVDQLVDSVHVFLQETLTLVLHLRTKEPVIQSSPVSIIQRLQETHSTQHFLSKLTQKLVFFKKIAPCLQSGT